MKTMFSLMRRRIVPHIDYSIALFQELQNCSHMQTAKERTEREDDGRGIGLRCRI